VAMVLLFGLGYGLQRGIINRVMDLPPIMTYILTFGIHLLITNIALKVWSHDFRPITTSYSGANIVVSGIHVPVARACTFALAVFMIAGLWLFLERTEIGRAIRATAMDRDVARLMGVNIRQVYAITFGIGAGITGVAGASISPFDIISPEMGMNYTLVAFCVVVLGGMGHLPGTLWGGAILGVVQSLAVTYLNASVSVAVTFFILFFTLIVRPSGIVGKGSVT
jgi:branched-chain amino acid transport system permease protein